MRPNPNQSLCIDTPSIRDLKTPSLCLALKTIDYTSRKAKASYSSAAGGGVLKSLGFVQAATMRKLRLHHQQVDSPSSESRFCFGLIRVAVSQIYQSVGFIGAQNSALEIITDIATRYLKAIAISASTSANNQGRTQSNLPDIIVALEDLASVQGFTGASLVSSRSLYASTVIGDLMRFVKYADEIPFALPLPPRKIFSWGEEETLFKYNGGGNWGNGRPNCEGKSLRHVPKWLPALPPVMELEERKSGTKWGCLCLDGVEWEPKGRELINR